MPMRVGFPASIGPKAKNKILTSIESIPENLRARRFVELGRFPALVVLLCGPRSLGPTPENANPRLSGLLLLSATLCLETAFVPDRCGGDGVLKRLGVKDLRNCDDPSLSIRSVVIDTSYGRNRG